ncbi:alpha-amylase [Sporolactobacillus sp. STSJ-5]|uniref:alpha-amylase n=1 Tax=Sporolactobacillus sp. STSJ-5 TaxID=2965076 RepID=UPI00351D4DA1
MMENGMMMQYFEWHLANDGKHWERLKADAEHLAAIGISAVWLPPVFKCSKQEDVGYSIYDLYDLGEFDQKGTVRTKYGTKADYLAAIAELHDHGLSVYADIVLNHKAGADACERFQAYEVNPTNRQEKLSEAHEIEGWTRFNFPGRKGKYSDFIWTWEHFSGVDYDQLTSKKAIYMIEGLNKGWADDDLVDNENGNYDYLMYADIDYRHPDVIREIKEWANWFLKTTGIDGFRLDAVKHINRAFIAQLAEHIRRTYRDSFYLVGEFWKDETQGVENYLEDTDFKLDLFDVTLHNNFYQAAQQGRDYDLRQILEGTLMKEHPSLAVTFVDNHDTQPGQSLESSVAPWFKLQAYSLILLRAEGFPVIFYGDYYGLKGPKPSKGFQKDLDSLMNLRRKFAYGDQMDYFQDEHCIGWTRSGTDQHPGGLVVILSTGDENQIPMNVGPENKGKNYADQMGHQQAQVKIDEDGQGIFPVNGGSFSVWTCT